MHEREVRVTSTSMGCRGGGVLAVVAVIAVAGVALFAAGSWLAHYKSAGVRHRWVGTFGDRDDVLARYPVREANASALELERLAASLGIDLVPRTAENRERPERGRTEFRDVKRELGTYLSDELERPSRRVEPPPPALAAFLDEHREEIEAIHRHLVDAEIPLWERRVDLLYAAPIPNLLGHIDLHKLLTADALARLHGGDREGALAGLEATWKLHRSLLEDPLLIEQLIAIAETRGALGLLRKIDSPPEPWRDRLFEDDFRERFLEALTFEGWVLAQVGESEHTVSRGQGLLDRTVETLAGPYVRYRLAVVSDRHRRQMEDFSRVRVLCDENLGRFGPSLEAPLPWWQRAIPDPLPDFTGSIERLARLEVDLEMTAKILEIEAMRRAGDEGWPERIPGIERSSVCPDDSWTYSRAPAGSVSLGFDRELSWSDGPGLELPTRFVATP